MSCANELGDWGFGVDGEGHLAFGAGTRYSIANYTDETFHALSANGCGNTIKDIWSNSLIHRSKMGNTAQGVTLTGRDTI